MSFNTHYYQQHAVRNDWNNSMPLFPEAREAGSCFIDGNSFVRNGTSAAAAIVPLPFAATAFVAASAAAGGFVGIPIGLGVVRDGVKKGWAAAKCGDLEGVVQNGLWTTVGATYTGLSSLLATEGVMILKGLAPPPAITPAFASLGVAMYGGLVAYGMHGLWKSSQFHSQLKSVVKSEGDRGALKWLSDQVTLTEEEMKREDSAKILQRKWNRFELRTNAACAALVREKLPLLMADFDPVAVRALILEVEKAAFKEKVKHIVLIVIGVLGIAASLCVILTTGPASPLLFAIGALVWVAVDSSKFHDYIGEKCWQWHLKKEPCLPALT
jgi:hypothetical protein